MGDRRQRIERVQQGDYRAAIQHQGHVAPRLADSRVHTQGNGHHSLELLDGHDSRFLHCHRQ